jgi:hypothetical protein
MHISFLIWRQFQVKICFKKSALEGGTDNMDNVKWCLVYGSWQIDVTFAILTADRTYLNARVYQKMRKQVLSFDLTCWMT